MYAVIRTGGKQYRVEAGQRLEVERLKADGAATDAGTVVELAPVLVVDGDTVLATPKQLSGAKVVAKVVGDSKGPKIRGFTYKSKSNQRRRWGHRQQQSLIEITKITPGGPKKAAAAKDAPAKDAPAKDEPAKDEPAKDEEA
jgi:large subunit ribosomal protein L21